MNGGDLAVTMVPRVRIRPRKGWLELDLGAVWQYRELLYLLMWREVKVRYKQTAIGATWVILQPLLTMMVFTIVFGSFAGLPSDGVPYPLFAYAALLPWEYFSQAMSRSVGCLIGDANIVRKVYLPRLLVPLASVATPLVDFSLSFVVLFGLMGWFGVVPTWGVFMIPVFLLLALVAALAVGLWLSPLNARYRDVRYAIPFLTQFWMYASPIAYPVSLVPEKWRLLYSLNPMVGVVEGFRWGLFGKVSPDVEVVGISAVMMLVLLCGGIVHFKRMEPKFADVV